MKTVFIGHPLSDDVEGNAKAVLKICSEVHSKEIIPVAPYLISLQYLNDEVIEDRKLGIDANLECFHRKYIDELWLFGDRISAGMKEEIALAKKLNIPIMPKSEGIKQALAKLIK